MIPYTNQTADRDPAQRARATAIAEACARGYSLVAYIDSDAFFRNASVSLPALLAKYGHGASDAELRSATAFFGWDLPFTLGPNAGIVILRNSARTRTSITHARAPPRVARQQHAQVLLDGHEAWREHSTCRGSFA